MKRYKEELNGLSFDQEAKQRIAQHLREAKPQRKKFPPVRRLAAAGVAAALCMTTGAAGAISLANHSPAFREFFSITSAEQETVVGASLLDLTFEDRNGSGTSITVCDITSDLDCIFVLMELEVPAGMTLPDIPEGQRGYILADGTDFYEHDPHRGCGFRFYQDEDMKKQVGVPGSVAIHSLPDSDPTDNKLPLLFQYNTNCMERPEEAHYIRLENYGALYRWNASEQQYSDAMLENLDFDIFFPLENSTPSYSFEGRLYTLLGNVTPVILENLVISPYSIGFDVFLPDPDAYHQAYQEHGPWQINVIMNDGSIISGQLAQDALSTNGKWSEKAQASYGEFVRAHVLLDKAIDPAKIYDIDFGDSSEMQDEPAFSLFYFKHPTYWSDVKEYR